MPDSKDVDRLVPVADWARWYKRVSRQRALQLLRKTPQMVQRIGGRVFVIVTDELKSRIEKNRLDNTPAEEVHDAIDRH